MSDQREQKAAQQPAPNPANATFDEIGEMKLDHVDVLDFCLLTDSYTVWLSEQAVGQEPLQRIAIPRKVFNKLLTWYLARKP